VSGRTRSSRLAGCLVALALLLAGCGTAAAPTTTASSASSDIGAVSVTGAAGSKPTVTVPTPFSVKQTTKVVLTKGTGPVVSQGQRVTVDYVGFNGTDGKEFDSSFPTAGAVAKKSPSFTLKKDESLPGLIKGIVGSTVGSRLLLAIPPEDAYGTQGVTSAGIGPTDTILIVLDVKAARSVLTRATGTPVAAKAGLPTVTLAADGKPKITLPAGNPPATLLVQSLITGTGDKVTKGQQITVNYTGIVWPGGRQFDSSWDTGKPATFAIGQGQLIAAWDEGLVGQPVGSQLLLVVPPDKGYGAQGQPSAQIKGTDTLVFVIDILDAT
jgi:peptidylprolyl isomerase